MQRTLSQHVRMTVCSGAWEQGVVCESTLKTVHSRQTQGNCSLSRATSRMVRNQNSGASLPGFTACLCHFWQLELGHVSLL